MAFRGTPTMVALCAYWVALGCGARSSLDAAWLNGNGGSAGTGTGGMRVDSSGGASDGGRSAGGRANGGSIAMGGDGTAGGTGGASSARCLTPSGDEVTCVTAIAAGQAHSCAVRGGSVYCWGWNSLGQLGDGTAVDRSTPVSVVGLPGPASAVSVAGFHSCALVNGDVYCWGSNRQGQLGTGVLSDFEPTPRAVRGIPRGVTSLAVGLGFTAAVAGGVA